MPINPTEDLWRDFTRSRDEFLRRLREGVKFIDKKTQARLDRGVGPNERRYPRYKRFRYKGRWEPVNLRSPGAGLHMRDMFKVRKLPSRAGEIRFRYGPEGAVARARYRRLVEGTKHMQRRPPLPPTTRTQNELARRMGRPVLVTHVVRRQSIVVEL